MEKKKMWYALPDSLLVQVFSHLNAVSLVQVGTVCQSWHRVSCDELLWKKLFHRDWKIDSSIPIASGKTSWKSEYKRLKHHTPVLESEVLTDHTHQVLHVSFSHNGDMFASCSKDGYVKVWNTTFPASVRYSSDMKMYSWNYTQFSQFNESDTLLLVSGVHFGAHTASGEIAVFNLSDCFTLQCRVLNKPYDIFGTWYTDDYLLAGRLHFLGHFISCSALWLNKAWQESDSEKKQIVKRLFKFYNKSASSIRTIMIANCLQSEESSAEESNGGNKPVLECGQREPSTLHQLSEQLVKGNPVSHNALSTSQWPVPNSRRRQRSTESSSMDVKVDFNAECQEACTVYSPIRYSLEYRRVESAREGVDSDDNDDNNSTSPDFEDPPLPWDEDWFELSEEDGSEVSNKINIFQENFRDNDVESEKEERETVDSIEEDLSGEKLLDPREKYLIFTTGSLTYTPHQIGFKRIKPFKFAEQVTETATLSQRIQERREKRNAPSVSPNWQDEHAIADHFDKVDHIIDLHGHIIGMGLSPDHRYLYVNSRPWPQNYVIEQPLFPPPIAQEIDIHVIDLVTLKEVGTMLRSHKAYTPNDECFFIFLDVSQQYVASGAEDKHGYLWDRHYGNCLAKLPHTDVVNSVAFNPADNEMLVTASDDYTLKIWRSKNRIQHLNIQKRVENSLIEINN
ncbi:F-box/WD repeat-containing protein 5-like isoform X2 [Limulus polyphemus]|uniref:F-box/WD repeat-containing protein 5-like isoform X2 n=1 Tax=Limulus polyphemus TaxID=6850 RepID=A0ABM1B8R0_LIMPO|nr:F-box/WD repeat-containing protein 5-like isoform X2 [Limulus polyphemus]XP_022244570.1 F-box/WD repeat-containing protein 5-like isoform X2 [Limulus polyphemus]